MHNPIHIIQTYYLCRIEHLIIFVLLFTYLLFIYSCVPTMLHCPFLFQFESLQLIVMPHSNPKVHISVTFVYTMNGLDTNFYF